VPASKFKIPTSGYRVLEWAFDAAIKMERTREWYSKEVLRTISDAMKLLSQ
jgi:hypothetical protein